ncbi:MAG TPA: PadR family transcriptional regulator [Clostridiales bacterium]|nr:PadR family transcriptional regulator [Clostridiales bacterium]
MDIQLKRGLTEVCVLALLARGDSYGYRLAKDTEQLMPMSESTLYPVLKRLQESGAVDTYSTEYAGRLRRYYTLTDAGWRQMLDFVTEWEQLGKVYEFIVHIKQEEEKKRTGGTP